jgi:hypothetical protein
VRVVHSGCNSEYGVTLARGVLFQLLPARPVRLSTT